MNLKKCQYLLLTTFILACSHGQKRWPDDLSQRPQEINVYFAKQALIRVHALAKADEIDEAVREAKDLTRRYPKTSAAEEAVLFRMQQLKDNNKIDEARDVGWDYLIKYPESPHTRKIREQLYAIGDGEQDREILGDGLEFGNDGELVSDEDKSVIDELVVPRSSVSFSDVPLLRERDLSSVITKNIGIILPLSGQYATYGNNVLTAIRLGFGMTNFSIPAEPISVEENDKVRLIIADSGGSSIEAVMAINKLVADYEVMMVLGGILQDTATAIAERCELYRVPILSLSRREHLTLLGPWVFRMGMTSSKQIKNLLDVAFEEKGLKKFAVLYPKHTYGFEMAENFIRQVNSRGGEIAFVEAYDPNQTTFTSLAKKITGKKQATKGKHYQICREEAKLIESAYVRKKALQKCYKELPPEVYFDALFIPDFPKTISYLVPALISSDLLVANDDNSQRIYKRSTKFEEVNPVQLLGSASWNSPIVAKRLGRQINGALFVDGIIPAGKKNLEQSNFGEKFTAITSSPPKLLDWQAFDAAHMVDYLFSQSEAYRPTSRLSLRESLVSLKNFPGELGPISFDSGGDSDVPLHQFIFENGQIVPYLR